jgi:hypothetical protein
MKSKVLLLALATTVFSLASKAQVSFGLRAGVNLQNINGKDIAGDDLEFDLKTGFHVGVNAEIGIAPDFYLQPGVLFSTKGAKEDAADDDDDLKVNLSYVEVPINLLYKPALGPGKLLLGFGPYVAYALGGSAKVGKHDKKDIEFEKDVTYTQYGTGLFTGTYYAKRMDIGGNLLFGYELASKISFQLNAQLGMVNINPEVTDIPGNMKDKAKFKNTGFGISVGYRF